MTYLNTLQTGGQMTALAIVRGKGWRRVLIDHASLGDMAVCNHILHAAFDNLAQQASLARRTFVLVCGYLFGARAVAPEGGTYDEGEAHADVPTSSVRVCWS